MEQDRLSPLKLCKCHHKKPQQHSTTCTGLVYVHISLHYVQLIKEQYVTFNESFLNDEDK